MSSREAQLEIELLRSKERVRTLEEVIRQQSEALKESAKLLQKATKVVRPAIPHSAKLLQAAEQQWRCADPFGDCPQWKLSDGSFSVAGGLFEADHIEPWHLSFKTSGNIQALCSACHNQKSRRERLQALEAEEEEE